MRVISNKVVKDLLEIRYCAPLLGAALLDSSLLVAFPESVILFIMKLASI